MQLNMFIINNNNTADDKLGQFSRSIPINPNQMISQVNKLMLLKLEAN